MTKAHTWLHQARLRGGSRILVKGSKQSFESRGGCWVQNLLKTRVFPFTCLKTAWFRKNLGGKGGRPQPPLDPLVRLVYTQHGLNTVTSVLITAETIPKRQKNWPNFLRLLVLWWFSYTIVFWRLGYNGSRANKEEKRKTQWILFSPAPKHKIWLLRKNLTHCCLNWSSIDCLLPFFERLRFCQYQFINNRFSYVCDLQPLQ